MKKTEQVRHDRPRFEELADWVTPSEARQYLGLSRSSMYELIHSQTLPCKRFGRLIRVPKSALRPEVEEASR
jgi:excisionase family DNA binding protein